MTEHDDVDDDTVADYFGSIEAGDVDAVGALLEEHQALPSCCDPTTEGTGLHVAVAAGQADVCRLLLERGVDLHARNADGRTVLHDSIEFGQPMLTEMFLELGAEVDISVAAILGRLDDVKAMLDADTDLVNDRSTHLSPLGWAAFGNQVDVAEELIRRGAAMDDGELCCAASVGHVEVGAVLLEHGADPNRLWDGAGALHQAAAMPYTNDAERFVTMLLDRGAQLDLPTAAGLTAAQIATQQLARLRPQDVDRRRGLQAVLVRLQETVGEG